MTKQEFLEKLRAALGNDLSGAVVSENVNYYKQYITDEVAKGKSEKEVIDELGDPWAIARTIIDAQENQEYTEGEYRSETTANGEYDSGKQNRYGNVHVFGLDSWWEETSSDTGACWNYRLDRGGDRRDYQHSCADRYSAFVLM